MKSVNLSEIVNIIGGIPAPKEVIAFNKDSGTPFVRMRDLGRYHISTNLHETEEKLSATFIESNKLNIVPKGTILIPRSGSVAQNHRAILGVDAIIVSHICGLIIKNPEIVSNKYLFYYLTRMDFSQIARKTTGLDAISFSDLGKVKVNLPSLETQNRIVATLDKIQSLIDKRKKTIALLDELTKATFLQMFGDPFLNKNKYNLSKLIDLGEWQSGGTPPRSNSDFFTGTVPWITSGELNDIFISDSKEKITETAINTSSTKIIERGSLLLGMYDTAALKSSITTVIATCNQAIAFSRLDDNLCSTVFIYYTIQLLKKRHLFQRLGARQQNLNLSNIKNIEIPLPNIENQKRFESAVYSILNKRSKLIQSSNLLELLFQSILQDVFNEKEVISEQDLFENLVKTFEKDDYQKDSRRLGYLTSTLKHRKFKDSETYDAAQKMAFALLESQMVEQYYNKERQKVELIAQLGK